MRAGQIDLAAHAQADGVAAERQPPERLLLLLRLIERTVLPRHIMITGAGAEITLDVAIQRLQLGVKSGNHFIIDDSLAAVAPAAHKLLRRRAATVTRHDETFHTHRTALGACAARALLRVSAADDMRHRIEPASVEEVWARAGFSVMALYEAAREQAGRADHGPARTFFDAVRARMAEAWLMSRDGWVMAAPQRARNLTDYAEMTKTARQLRAWRETDALTPQLAFATRPPHTWIWCIASDAHHTALLRCPPLKWAATLNAWNEHTASDARPPGAESNAF